MESALKKCHVERWHFKLGRVEENEPAVGRVGVWGRGGVEEGAPCGAGRAGAEAPRREGIQQVQEAESPVCAGSAKAGGR